MAAEPHVLESGVTVFHSLASRVYLDRVHGTATKVYAPGLPVKLLYWLAFQAPFPYVRNMDALLAAEARRRIASLLTRLWFGRDMVAPVLDIRCDDEGCVYITKFINGQMPVDKKRARAFLKQIAKRFQEVGLPTWQINPRNPKAHQNLIEMPNGDYKIIDLESAVVSPLLPLGQWLDALRAGLVPVFDDVFVSKTRRYVAQHEEEVRSALGERGLTELKAAIDAYEEHARAWRQRELRLWAKLLRGGAAAVRGGWRAARVLWLPATIRSLRNTMRQAADSGKLADAWVRKGIARWREEGRLDEEAADEIEKSLEAPETLSVLGHLGAHIAMSVPLRFPFGSVGRFAWTLAFRAKAEWRALLQRKADEKTRAARRIHTLTVAVLSAVPGIGAAAYLAAEPLRKNRPLMAVVLDQALRKLPLGLYRRLHISALTCWLASSPAVSQRTRQRWAWLRPSSLVAEARTAFTALRPHTGLIVSVLGFNVAALAVAGIFGGIKGTTAAFDEFGPITSLKVAESLAAGAMGVLAYRLFWRQPGAERRQGAAGSFFWLVSGIGLSWLALDDYLQVHERVGSVLKGHIEFAMLNNVDDMIVLGYGLAGLTVVALFWRELLASRPVATLLGAGTALAVVMLAVDFFAPHGSALAGLENPAHLMAVAFLLLAYMVKNREVAAEVHEAEMMPLLPGPKAENLAQAMVCVTARPRQERVVLVGD